MYVILIFNYYYMAAGGKQNSLLIILVGTYNVAFYKLLNCFYVYILKC